MKKNKINSKIVKSDEVIVHGECFVFKSNIPSNAQKKIIDAPFMIIANSEVTGNHHVIDIKDGINFYENNGILFMSNAVPATFKCVMPNRHDEIILEPGSYEFGTQKEYDYFTESLRNVRD